MNASCHNCIGYLGIWLRLTEMKNQLCAWEWKHFFRWYSLFISPLATGKQRQEPLRDVRSLIEANMFNRTFFGALCRCQCCLPLRLKASWELENSLKTEWSPLTTSQPTKMDDGEDGILNICISLIFLNLTISTAKFLWNIAEKSWNLEGFVQLQLPDAQNAGGVLQATRLLVCQSQGSPKLESSFFWLGDQRGWFGITVTIMYYLYYSKFGECLPCALIKWSASIEKLMWTVWQFQSASRRRNPLLSAHALWRAWWTERGTFYWGHLWGVFTSKTAFWKYRKRHDMYIIYAWIFICIIHIDVYSCMPLIYSCRFVIYDIPMSFLAPPDWCCPADWCHAICTSRPRISKAPFFVFGSGFEGYLDAYKCYRRSTIKKVKAPKRPQQLTIIGGSKGLWEARKDGESWSHSNESQMIF